MDDASRGNGQLPQYEVISIESQTELDRKKSGLGLMNLLSSKYSMPPQSVVTPVDGEGEESGQNLCCNIRLTIFENGVCFYELLSVSLVVFQMLQWSSYSACIFLLSNADGDEPLLSGSGIVSKDVTDENLLEAWHEALMRWHQNLNQRPKQVQALVRKSIPEALRGEVWQLLARCTENSEMLETYRVLITMVGELF